MFSILINLQLIKLSKFHLQTELLGKSFCRTPTTIHNLRYFLRHFSSLSILKPPSCSPRPLNHLFDVQTSSNHTHAPSNSKTTTFQYHFQKINTASIFFLPSKLRLFPWEIPSDHFFASFRTICFFLRKFDHFL